LLGSGHDSEKASVSLATCTASLELKPYEYLRYY